MAALKVVQDTPNQLVLSVPLAQRLPNLVSLIFVIIVGVSILSQFTEGGFGQDPASVLIILFLAFFVFRSLSSAFTSTAITLDASARRATRSNSLLGFPLGQTSMPFDKIQRVVVGSRLPVAYGGTMMRGGWLVRLAATDGPDMLVDWNGTHDEMAPIGSKVAKLVNKPLLDEYEQARSAAGAAPDYQPIQDFGGGTGGTYAPPVAVPSPLGRPPQASSLPDKAPPPNTLTVDSANPDHARFEQQAGEPAPASPVSMDMGTGMPPIYATDMGTGSTPPPYSMDMGTGGTAPISTTPPALELPDQAPLGSLTQAQTSIPDVPSAVEASPTPVASQPRSMQALQKAIADDPTDSVSYYELGRILQQGGGLDQALDMYQNAARLDPMNGAVQNNMGAIYLQRGKMKEAELAFRRSVGLDPFSFAGHYNLGLLLWRLGRQQDSRQEFSRAQENASTDMQRQLAGHAAIGRVAGPIMNADS